MTEGKTDVKYLKSALKKLYKENYLSILDREKLISALAFNEHFSSYIDGKVLI